ncbi:hypothetical protein [Streptomyces sp. S.PB5]|uniref:hypothetical protein n=1 Tax=Streptomyces sp. S.PB5 TaxID=3020844 RepID=UPI0025B0829E|nr:hypothetical protein [Streptomyces sp. S.PB5]MDN3028609.1 hypothetical protein [Streptomyces sp. S.PB5]
MNELMTAVLAVVSALGGSAITGYFTVRGAQRQADAAWASAQRLADAQLEVARETLGDQVAAARRHVRRSAYVAFLGRVDQARQATVAWSEAPASTALSQARDRALSAVDEPLNVVRLEGPIDVASAAETVTAALATAPHHFPQAHAEFLVLAQAALRS